MLTAARPAPSTATRVLAKLGNLAIAFVALAIVCSARPAHADGSMHLGINWSRTLERTAKKIGIWRDNSKETGTHTLQRGPVSGSPFTSTNGTMEYGFGGPSWRRSDANVGSVYRLDVPTSNTPWFGVGPEVSIIARDWGSAKSLVGGEIAVTDAIRPSKSFRMGLARIRLGSGRITPFAQLGLGAYRIDNDIVATRMRDTEVAAQVGGGIEIHLMKSSKVEWDMAAETCFTQIVRNEREPQNVADTRMWNSLVASRIRF